MKKDDKKNKEESDSDDHDQNSGKFCLQINDTILNLHFTDQHCQFSEILVNCNMRFIIYFVYEDNGPAYDQKWDLNYRFGEYAKYG